MLLPAEAQPLLAALLPHLTRPTYTRLVVLTAAAVKPCCGPEKPPPA